MTVEPILDDLSPDDAVRLAADIVVSYVAYNKLDAALLPSLLETVHKTLTGLGSAGGEVKPPEKQKPAVPISRSVQNDHIVCLEDGKKLTMLKRYLKSRYNLSPEDYRRKWNLPPDYPMVAPDYAGRRSEFAKAIGLGKGVRRKSVKAA